MGCNSSGKFSYFVLYEIILTAAELSIQANSNWVVHLPKALDWDHILLVYISTVEPQYNGHSVKQPPYYHSYLWFKSNVT